ncbi:methyltransferase FkbM family protein [Nostoc sp. NIES-4103]|nr:methyltransferase FkbM family protein [Nostoc sp. NIES-4103]
MNTKKLRNKVNYLTNHRAFKDSPLKVTYRLIYWWIVCQLSIPQTISVKKWNVKFFLPPGFYRTGNTSLFVFRETYEPELEYIERTLSSGQVFIDAGANCGIYTLLASKLVGDSGLVLSFEPGVESLKTLEHNLEINGVTNVKLFKTALSEREGTAQLYHIENAPTSYSLGSDKSEGISFEEVQITTIDNVLAREGIERVDFIKIDVEGAEELVFRGATSLFSRMKPIVIFEVNSQATTRLNLSSDGAFNFLKQLGYQFFKVQNTGELVRFESIKGKTGNILAIHQANQ